MVEQSASSLAWQPNTEQEVIEQLWKSPPRAPLGSSLGITGPRVTLIILAIVGVAAGVGTIAGIVGFYAAAEIGVIQDTGDRSGVFVDGTGAFWSAVGAVFITWAVAAAAFSTGHSETQQVRAKLVEYRSSVSAWQTRVSKRFDEIQANLTAREHALPTATLLGDSGWPLRFQISPPNAILFASMSFARSRIRESRALAWFAKSRRRSDCYPRRTDSCGCR